MRKTFLMMDMLQRYYWFDDALNSNLHRHGWPDVSRAQSLVLVHLALGINRASVIAKNLGVTRQAMSQMLREMQTRDLVQFAPDPQDGRAVLVEFSDQSSSIREDAVAILDRLEQTLAARIGAAKVRSLHTALEMDWGEIPLFDDTASGEPVPVGSGAPARKRSSRRARQQ